MGGNLIASLEGHDRSVNCVAFSAAEKLLASASDDKTVILWGASP
jgi:WD40 repeat protein